MRDWYFRRKKKKEKKDEMLEVLSVCASFRGMACVRVLPCHLGPELYGHLVREPHCFRVRVRGCSAFQLLVHERFVLYPNETSQVYISITMGKKSG